MNFLGIDLTEAASQLGLLQPILNKVTAMSQQVADLQSAVSALTTTITSAIANETALKQKLDAAIAENVTLKQQLKDAQAGASDPADAAAIVATTTVIQQQNQKLADATAATSPSN